jgi:hypothetical protein
MFVDLETKQRTASPPLEFAQDRKSDSSSKERSPAKSYECRGRFSNVRPSKRAQERKERGEQEDRPIGKASREPNDKTQFPDSFHRVSKTTVCWLLPGAPESGDIPMMKWKTISARKWFRRVPAEKIELIRNGSFLPLSSLFVCSCGFDIVVCERR